MGGGGNGAGESMARIEVPSGPGVQFTGYATQENQYIQRYIETLTSPTPSAPATEQVVAGEVPQPPSAFQLRGSVAGCTGSRWAGCVRGPRGDGDARVR